MSSTRCFNCGRVNSAENADCEGCGEELLRGEEYESRLQELKDYEDLRKRHGISAIMIAILMLLLSCPAAQWLTRIVFPEPGPGVAGLVQEYTPPLVAVLVFLIAVLPLILRRWSILRRYRWTRERMRALDGEVRRLPKDFFETPAPESRAPGSSAQAVNGPPMVLVVIVFGLLALVVLDKYGDLGLLDAVKSLVGVERAVAVSGEYRRHYDAADLGGGVAQSEQTWSYVFRTDGTYTTFLDGYQQYSGTWSQSGNALMVNIPAIPGMGTSARSFHAKVSLDGNSFTAGEEEYTKVE